MPPVATIQIHLLKHPTTSYFDVAHYYIIKILILIVANSHITKVACVEISVEPPLQSLNYKLRE